MTRIQGGFRPPRSLVGALLFVSIVAGRAAAGVIDPTYESHLKTIPGSAQVSVIVFLADQAPIPDLDQELRLEHATLAVRHERVINDLQAVANDTQELLLTDLAERKARGEVTGFTPYWIANLVVVKMSVEAVREVASRPDVAVVYPNFSVSPIESAVGAIKGAPETALAGTTPGLRAIHADRVWTELGITGAGRLVCSLDTGVSGSHPALASRWRGAEPGIPWEWAWKDVLGGNTQFPTDADGHGTHTMGTLVGLGAATQDTIGVAWGAQWIACNAINQGVGSEFDNDVIAAFQWIADPDGDPQTIDDVPDVVQNAWRVNEQLGYLDCDPRWWVIMDGCEAAGCAVVFSAGGDGPGAQTIGSPADRITTPTNAFAVGAVSAQVGEQFPYTITSFSSRGPSGCDGVTKKPEVVAPGVNVRSSTNNGAYASWSGTAMAVPHVAGVIALMRQADPDLDVTTAKQIILETARDEGTAGEDNTYGWGFIDAYAAVSRVLATQGIGWSGAPPAGGLMLAARPNPFDLGTFLSYSVPARGPVVLRVHDVQGRLVRTLVDAVVEQGRHITHFDGRNADGARLASGTYFVELDAGGHEVRQKVGLIR